MEGKENRVLVIDSGSSLMKAGFAGKDNNIHIIEAVVGRPRKNKIGILEEELGKPKDIYIGWSAYVKWKFLKI